MSQLLYCASREQAKPHPEWCLGAVLYEMNVRQFTREGTFAAAQTHLPRLKDLGVGVIWLMPVFPIGLERRKGALGSYYSIRDYKAVNEEFGTIDDMRSFIQAAHQLGIKVILDWVANHTSRDAVWTTNKDWYVWDEQRGEIATPFDWSDTAQLNYESQQMRWAMIDALKYWLEEVGLDGYRMDMAMLMPLDFWEQAIGVLREVKSDIFMLAEAQGPEFHAVGFDVTYGWDIHHLLCDIASGHANADSLSHMLQMEAVAYSSDAIRMQFTSNHDENSWNGTEFERLGSAVFQMAALTYILPGMPLIYSGQEAELDRRLEFFDKDQITWKANTYAERLYKQLSALKHSHPALRAGKSGADMIRIDNSESWRILSVKRKLGDKKIIALFNFSNQDATFRVWDSDFDGNYSQIGSAETAHLQSDRDFYLPPYGWFIYYT